MFPYTRFSFSLSLDRSKYPALARVVRTVSILASMSSRLASMLPNIDSTVESKPLGVSGLQSFHWGLVYIARASRPRSACSAALTSLAPPNCSRLRPIQTIHTMTAMRPKNSASAAGELGVIDQAGSSVLRAGPWKDAEADQIGARERDRTSC